MKKIVILCTLFLLTACSTTYPAITEYRIKSTQNLPNIEKSSCKKASITVSQVFIQSSLMSKKMRYIIGKYKENTYNKSAWAENPNRAITDAIVKSLQISNIFQSVNNYKSLSRTDYTLESRVETFAQYFSEDEKESIVKIEITFSLIDNKTAKTVSSKYIKKEKKTESADAKGGVIALNELLNETLHEMLFWITGSCQ